MPPCSAPNELMRHANKRELRLMDKFQFEFSTSSKGRDSDALAFCRANRRASVISQRRLPTVGSCGHGASRSVCDPPKVFRPAGKGVVKGGNGKNE